MSITLYTGTPGSGKSFHAARDIVAWLKRGKPLISNFPVNPECVMKKLGKGTLNVSYSDNSDLTVDSLVAYHKKHLKFGVEHQCLVVIDEAQVLFNCRDFGKKDRNAWVQFFPQHRKLGYDFLLITQHDRMIDRQIRNVIETEVRHRKLNNYGTGGAVLSLFTGMSTWFIAIEYWYGGNKLMLGKQMFRYQKKYEKVYDSYRLFTDMAGLSGAGDTAGWPQGRGPAVAPVPPEPAPAADEPSISLPLPDTSTPVPAVDSGS